MAFSGTELEEVAPTTVGTTCAGGGKVFAIGSGQTAIMDDATSEAYLYSSPGDNARSIGDYYVTASSAYSSATSKAWYGTIGAFCSITAAGITGSVSSGTSGGHSGSPSYRYLYCHNIATTGDYVWGEWVRSTTSYEFYWARLTISTSSVWTSASSGSGYPAGLAIGVGGYMYAASGTTVTQYNPVDGTSTGTTYTLPLAAAPFYPTLDGVTIYWTASSGVVTLNTSTGITSGAAATPAGMPAPVVRPTVQGGVMYWLSAGDKMVAFKLSTGQWKEDTLVTNRANRFGINASNGKLWIPSTTTP